MKTIQNAVMFSKPQCPFCVKAKSLMDENNIPYRENIVGEDCTKEEMQYAIGVFKKGDPVTTVPQIVLYEKDEKGSTSIEYIGGCDEFYKYMGK